MKLRKKKSGIREKARLFDPPVSNCIMTSALRTNDDYFKCAVIRNVKKNFEKKIPARTRTKYCDREQTGGQAKTAFASLVKYYLRCFGEQV